MRANGPARIRRSVQRMAMPIVVLMAAGCYPGNGPTNVEDLDVVLTTRAPDVDFNSYSIYALPDTVVHIMPNIDEVNDIIELPRTYDELILDLVAENMEKVGYARELDPESNGTELVLLVGAVGTKRTSWYMGGGWWDWWGYYPGYPGWGWYYPPYFEEVTIEQGSLVLFLLDPGDQGGNDAQVIWAGAARGLVDTRVRSGTRITNAINQMFEQSPYLGSYSTIQ